MDQSPVVADGLGNGISGAFDGAFDQGALVDEIARLNRIGVALSAERDINRLLELILLGAMELTRADGGTLYSVTDARSLKFEIMRSHSMGVAMGGTTGTPIPFPPLPLYSVNGEPNLHMVAAFAVLKDQTVNIPDAYEAEGFDFSGTRTFDRKTGYRSTSFLTVPLKNHENEIVAVLQLINATDPHTGVVRPFHRFNQHLAESLASQAAIALSNQQLINGLKHLFESFIEAIAAAIDEKSPYTGGHCHRVPVLADLLAEAACATTSGPLADFKLSPDQRYELRIASWLHDCGKVVIPEHVVDKATKLETITDRIQLVATRFEAVRLAKELDWSRQQAAWSLLDSGERVAKQEALETERVTYLQQMVDDLAFIRQCNIGDEFMSQERKQRIEAIAFCYHWTDLQGVVHRVLTEDEVNNLQISRGTISDREREVINNHVTATQRILSALPFPKKMREVLPIACSHHERMDGKGYPKGLTGAEMSVQARILAIADVFEALTAFDRPYKPGKTLSQALRILGFMKKEGHIDPDLFRLFIERQVYLRYAEAYLRPEQFDEVNPAEIPGYEG